MPVRASLTPFGLSLTPFGLSLTPFGLSLSKPRCAYGPFDKLRANGGAYGPFDKLRANGGAYGPFDKLRANGGARGRFDKQRGRRAQTERKKESRPGSRPHVPIANTAGPPGALPGCFRQSATRALRVRASGKVSPLLTDRRVAGCKPCSKACIIAALR